jgi:hypothetical protein
MPVGQSPFFEQGVPATPLAGWAQLPFWQTRLPLQLEPAQQACEAPPQLGALVPPPPLLPPGVVLAPEPPPVG